MDEYLKRLQATIHKNKSNKSAQKKKILPIDFLVFQLPWSKSNSTDPSSSGTSPNPYAQKWMQQVSKDKAPSVKFEIRGQ